MSGIRENESEVYLDITKTEPKNESLDFELDSESTVQSDSLCEPKTKVSIYKLKKAYTEPPVDDIKISVVKSTRIHN